jgi:hypothetical protein
MHLNKFKCFLQGIFNRTENTFLRKRNEYANDQDVFISFKKGKDFSFHNESEQVAYGYLCKHLESIRSMLEKLPDKEPDENLINEKFGDAINYLIIIEGLLIERLESHFKK